MFRRLCPLLLAFALVAGFAVGCGDEEEDGGGEATIATDAPTAPSAGGGCRTVPAPPTKPDGEEDRPSKRLARGKTHRIAFTTNCGEFTVELDLDTAPKAAASMASLARKGFFDQTVFHRIVPGFVIQGGDPTATGMGGPGYRTVDDPPGDATYTKGVVAMAKGADEPAGSAGSQFFVVTGADAQLPPDYAVLGKVVEGLDVAERIGTLGDANTEQPTAVVVIRKATAESE